MPSVESNMPITLYKFPGARRSSKAGFRRKDGGEPRRQSVSGGGA
jgi:hypothetical protein